MAVLVLDSEALSALAHPRRNRSRHQRVRGAAMESFYALGRRTSEPPTHLADARPAAYELICWIVTRPGNGVRMAFMTRSLTGPRTGVGSVRPSVHRITWKLSNLLST
mgnify:CR=1 FL=1